MKFRVKAILLCLSILLSFSIANAQKPERLLIDDSFGEWKTSLIVLDVFVQSSKKGYLRDLTHKEFEVYDEKKLQKIEFFIFDESKNQYAIGFYQEDFTQRDKWRDIKVKVKLPREKKKDYGKISVRSQKGYYSNRN